MNNRNQQEIPKYMAEIENLLKIGSQYLLKNWGHGSIEVSKGERDFALKTDITLEKIYKQSLLNTYPDIPILGEELSPKAIPKNFKGKFWAIDPIDGTANYSKGLPEYGSSIALIENGKSIAVGVSFPSLKELYLAGRDEGAFLNGAKISVAKTYKLKDSILAYGDFSVKNNYTIENQTRLQYLTSFVNEVLRIRMPGSAALQLAWLASGKIDISLTLSNNAWDVQGGTLLVREAGGCVYDFDGSEHSISSKYTIASNKMTKRKIVDLISHLNIQVPSVSGK